MSALWLNEEQERALGAFKPSPIRENALTCCALRFVELTAGDQAAPIETYLSDALMLAFFSPGWIRTSDQPLRRRVLFPLSYRQIWQ